MIYSSPVLHQLDQKITYPHYDFKHLTEKYFEIGMKLDDFLIQLVKYCKSYKVGNSDISLLLDVEDFFLEMDCAIPLGIIVNELVSNSLKHAFPGGRNGKIHIELHRKDNDEIELLRPEGRRF